MPISVKELMISLILAIINRVNDFTRDYGNFSVTYFLTFGLSGSSRRPFDDCVYLPVWF